jgi:SAM-dependent methyltransferase
MKMNKVRLNPTATDRESLALDLWESLAPERDQWIARNRFFHDQDYRYMKFLIPEGLRVLELGCGTGRLLDALKPSQGVGIDLSPKMIEIATRNFPSLEFLAGNIERADTFRGIKGPFDVIVLSDTIGFLEDCESTLAGLHQLCAPETRIVIAYHNALWGPLFALAQALGLRMPTAEHNWLSTDDIANLAHLAGFEVIKREWRQLVPWSFFGLGNIINRFIAPLPLFRRLSIRTYEVARPKRGEDEYSPSVSVIIPCRNEKGNIEAAITRMPAFCDDLEIVFVEGHSQDGTWEEVRRVRKAYPEIKIQCLQQDGKGKGDAVRKGFDAATGEVLMILDADLTVRPEDLPKFYRAIATGKGEFINGSRLVYPVESGAMQFLNLIANRIFAALFSYLLNQRFTDTLCGTKVLSKESYQRISNNRHYFGDFDPFGDFDLIFGAAKLNMKIQEIPVRYANRTYGSTQISRFQHGWLLLRMVAFAFRKLKAF